MTLIAADGIIDEAERSDLARIIRGDRKYIDVAREVMQVNGFRGVIDLWQPRRMRNRCSQHSPFPVILPWQMASLREKRRQYCSYTWKIRHS
jgi:hypothetical protein